MSGVYMKLEQYAKLILTLLCVPIKLLFVLVCITLTKEPHDFILLQMNKTKIKADKMVK